MSEIISTREVRQRSDIRVALWHESIAKQLRQNDGLVPYAHEGASAVATLLLMMGEFEGKPKDAK